MSEAPVLTVNPCPLCKSGHTETWSYNRDCSMHGAAGGVKCKVCGHSVKVKGDDRDDTGRSCLNAAIMQWNGQSKYARVGNVAACREALTKVSEWMAHRIATGGFEASPTIPTVLEDVVLPALSAPPRNCDRFGGDYKMLNTAWFDWTGSPSGQNPDGTVKLTFAEWLLAPATEGGAK